MINVEWIKCQGDVWCRLEALDLSSINEKEGVYIIWHAGSAPHTVYVGKGEFQDRFSKHRNNPKILQYSSKGTLFVTWAAVPDSQQAGVELYLAQRYKPLVGTHDYAGPPITVNTPFQ